MAETNKKPGRAIQSQIGILKIADRYRAGTILGGKVITGGAAPDEATAVRALLRLLSQDGPFADEVSLALDLELSGTDMQALLEGK